MENLSIENTNNIPEKILNMYKIEGYGDVAYAKYLVSKKLFESKSLNFGQNEENQSLLLKTKNNILEQSEGRITSSIMEALQNDNIEIQRIGASMIKKAPENQREGLEKILYKKILNALNSQNIQIQRIAVNMVQFAQENTKESLKEIVLQKIVEAFNSNDVGIQRIMAKKISVAPKERQDYLREITYQKIIEALNHEDIGIQKMATTMVQYAPVDKQSTLKNLVKEKFELAKQQGKFNQIVESSLYVKNDKNNTSTFSRDIFSKTGSETTLLLGKQFKNNLIIRHIENPCFLAWEKAYEGYKDWSEAGFDYVPIEPIYSFDYDNRSKLTNVISGVLDVNLEEWYAFSGDSFKERLDEQKNKIMIVLTKQGIDHGHPNDSNFCLRFYRNKDGSVDISKVPKIYLIDFDQAVKYYT